MIKKICLIIVILVVSIGICYLVKIHKKDAIALSNNTVNEINVVDETNVTNNEINVENNIEEKDTLFKKVYDKKDLDVSDIDYSASIAFVPFGREEDFCEYNGLDIADLANVPSCGNGKSFKIIYLPKDEEVKVSVYEASITDEGTIDFSDNEQYFSGIGPIVIDCPETEYIPNKVLVVTHKDGFIQTIPIQFSGEDGKLILEYEDIFDATSGLYY